MKTSEIILTVIMFVCSAVSLLFSVLQFMEKGPLLNNAWFYASKDERRKINRKPYYRQSAIVLLFLFFVFLSVGLNLITKRLIFLIIEYVLLAAVFFYAIASTIIIQKNNKDK